MTALIYKKMSDVMKDVGAIGKNQTNTTQGFKFRGIDNFVNALYPALTKHGVFMTPKATSYTHELKDVTRSSGKAGVDKHVAILMEYTFYAEDGSSVTVGPIPAEGLDSGDKATNKALSAALKYALIQTFSVPTEDMAEADLESPVLGTERGKDEKAQPPSTSQQNAVTLQSPAASLVTATLTTGALAKATTAVPAATPVETMPNMAAAKPRRKAFTTPASKTQPAQTNGSTNGSAGANGWD
jgi:hypothetical protein